MSRKRRLNKKKLLSFIFIIVLIVLLSGIIIYKFGNKNNNVKEDIKEEVKENDKISLIMVGDNLIHDKIYKEARKNALTETREFMSQVMDLLAQCLPKCAESDSPSPIHDVPDTSRFQDILW